MEKLKKRHESARNSENDEKSKFLWVFTKKIEKIFFVKTIFLWKNICLVRTMLIFSTWKELDSDLNAGRRGILDQLHGKNETIIWRHLERDTKGSENG